MEIWLNWYRFGELSNFWSDRIHFNTRLYFATCSSGIKWKAYTVRSVNTLRLKFFCSIQIMIGKSASSFDRFYVMVLSEERQRWKKWKAQHTYYTYFAHLPLGESMHWIELIEQYESIKTMKQRLVKWNAFSQWNWLPTSEQIKDVMQSSNRKKRILG